MKKILIPFVGLFVLILLTPFILGKIANSNIDDKISQLQKEGVKIKEIKKDISYLNSNRELELKFNNKIIENSLFKIELSFKNLPITTAVVNVLGDIKSKYLNLENIKFKVSSKNLKTFKYQIFSIKDFKIEDFKGIVNHKKYTNIDGYVKRFDYKKLFTSQNNYFQYEVKDLKLGLFNGNWKGEKWKFKYKGLSIKGINSEENISTHLNPQGKYSFEDKFYSKKLGINIKMGFIGFSNFDWNLKGNNFNKDSFDNSNLNLNIKWDKTEYKKEIVEGGILNLKVKILNSELKKYKDLELNLDLTLDKSLFDKVTIDLNPEIVKKWFKNYQTHIEIKNGVIKINGNRI